VRLVTLSRASLLHYWRTHLAVVLGVATAVAVLAGSLLVGESVRESLARLALARLGRTAFAVQSARPFQEGLAAALDSRLRGLGASESGSDTPASAPLLDAMGIVTDESGARLAADVRVYGVDERFFGFQRTCMPRTLSGRAALLSEALARELTIEEGASLLIKLPPAAEIPGSTLFGRRDEPGRRLRVTMRGVLRPSSAGDFALRPGQQDVRAAFVPLTTLQRALGLDGQANTILVGDSTTRSAGAEGSSRVFDQALADATALEDLGLRLEAVPGRRDFALESSRALLDDATVKTATDLAARQGLPAVPVLIYLVNTIRAGGREIPYSLAAGLGDEGFGLLPGGVAEPGPEGLVLNQWAARELGVRPGDSLTLEYFLWREEGRLETASAPFTLTAVVPLEGLAGDRHLVPSYPGITESLHLADWDPPFPVDLKRIRPPDEAYWDAWRTTPKVFLSIATAQRLWGHRLGRVTSLRLVPATTPALVQAPTQAPDADVDLAAVRSRFASELLSALVSDPSWWDSQGFAVSPVREEALRAARGTTDFGEYFVYFSFFLVVAALLLAGLFFRLGLEQRLRELGLLRAFGFAHRTLAAQFLGEGAALAVVGGLLGVLGAPLYAGSILKGLATVWVGAVGTRDLVLHAGPLSLGRGFAGGALAALLTVLLTVRRLVRLSPRQLLAGSLESAASPRTPPHLASEGLTPTRFFPRLSLAVYATASPGAGARLLALLAAAFLLASVSGLVPQTAAFFATGALLLTAALLATRAHLTGRPRLANALPGIGALGRRGASFRPGRSLLCIALVASASFVIVSVGSFRRSGSEDLRDRKGEAGGFALLASSLQPLHSDPGTPSGRAALGLPEGEPLASVTTARFRLSRGDDASCLNLYRPRRPTVLGATPAFLREGRFSFQSSLAATAEERANPWLLLERKGPPGVLPVAVDGNSLAYVFHRRLGDRMPLGDSGLEVLFVAALRPGLFQSELLTGEAHFQGAFPGEDGYRFFLLDPPQGARGAVTEAFESRLSDHGFDVSTTAERLAAFHRVENTYISTFQTLGALGLLLGTLGLGTVLLRNALERRRELALLQAVGFNRGHVRRLVLSENALLLGLGLGVGVGAALVAIAPALWARGQGASLATLVVLVLAVSVTGMLVSWLAVVIIARLPLLSSLRSE
jgi:ABC-type lipoprotein release transport system permease subunit